MPAKLRWLDAPPAATLASARDLLRRLGALDAAGKVTPHGRAMQEFPAHPRLAHMMLKSVALDAAPLAAELAAILSDRDLLRAGGAGQRRDSDLRTRLELLRKGGAELDRGAVERVRRAQRSFLKLLGSAREDSAPVDSAAVLLALAYPDRIGRKRPGGEGRYQLANGRGAVFESAESVARQDFIVAIDLDDREREARVRLAIPLDKQELLETFADEIERRDELAWDERSEAVIARRAVRLGELLIEEKPLADAPREASAAAMLEGVRLMGLEALPWDDDYARPGGAGRIRPGAGAQRSRRLAGCSRPDALAHDLAWLEPFLDGITRRSQLSRVPLLDALRSRLSYEQLRRLDELAPDPHPAADRLAHAHRLSRRQRARRLDAHAGGVRPGGDAAHRRRRGAGDVQTTVTGATPAAGDARSRQLLAQRLCRGAQGHAWPISAALLARGSAAGRAHAARQAARLIRSDSARRASRPWRRARRRARIRRRIQLRSSTHDTCVTSSPSSSRSLNGTPMPSPKLYELLLSEKLVVLPLASARLPESSYQFIPTTAFRWKWSAMGHTTTLLRKKLLMAVFPISGGHGMPGTGAQELRNSAVKSPRSVYPTSRA